MDKNINIPAISVLMPVYNAEKYLNDAINSILSQSFTDFEFLIIDDGSTDKSPEIIKSFQDPRIVFIQKASNTGLIDTLNFGVEQSKGKYIARMDADDISLKDRFLLQHKYLEENQDVLVLGTFYKIVGTNQDTSGFPVSHNEVKVFTLTGCPVGHPTVLIRKEVFTVHGIWYDQNYLHAEDYDLWVRILEVGKIENIPQVLLEYRVHEEQVSSKEKEVQNNASDKILVRLLRKSISFDNKKYSQEFACKILLNRTSRISCGDLILLKALINDLYSSNIQLKFYDNASLEKLLNNIWLKYSFTAYDYGFTNLSAIMSGKHSHLTAMNFSLKLKYILKSFVGYKSN